MSRETSPEAEAQRFVEARERWGVTACKAKVGGRLGRDTDASPGRTEALIPALRRILGAQARLMVDANGGFSPGRAIAVGRLLEAHGYVHFEEPCPYWELEQTAQVAAALDIAVAGGEQDFDEAQFVRMIALPAVDVVQCDVGYIGGFSRALAVGRRAIAAGRGFLPHSANTSFIHLFSIHLLATLGGGWVERNVDHHGPDSGLFAGDITVRDGQVQVPTVPGWGREPAQAWLAAATHGETRQKR